MSQDATFPDVFYFLCLFYVSFTMYSDLASKLHLVPPLQELAIYPYLGNKSIKDFGKISTEMQTLGKRNLSVLLY